MVRAQNPLLRTLRVFGLPSAHSPIISGFLDEFRIMGPIQSIVPNRKSRSLDITMYHALCLEVFLEKAKYPHAYESLKFMTGEPSKLPVELLARLIYRNATRALELKPLEPHMDKKWLMQLLPKFGTVEKLEIDEKNKSAVVHYMSVSEADLASRSITKARMINPIVRVRRVDDRCDEFLFRDEPMTVAITWPVGSLNVGAIFRRGFLHKTLNHDLSHNLPPSYWESNVEEHFIRQDKNTVTGYFVFKSHPAYQDFMTNFEVNPMHASLIKRSPAPNFSKHKNKVEGTLFGATKTLRLANLDPYLKGEDLVKDFHKFSTTPFFVRTEDRSCAHFYFPSPMLPSMVIDAIWKGKIDRVRYKGLEVTYGSDHSHNPSPVLTTPKHAYLEPLVTHHEPHMDKKWLMQLLPKFGNVEKLEVDEKNKSAVVHYMSVSKADIVSSSVTFQKLTILTHSGLSFAYASHSITKARMINPAVGIRRVNDRCDEFLFRDEPMTVAITWPATEVDVGFIFRRAFFSKGGKTPNGEWSPDALPALWEGNVDEHFIQKDKNGISTGYFIFKSRPAYQDFMTGSEVNPMYASLVKRSPAPNFPRHRNKVEGTLFGATKILRLANLDPYLKGEEVINDFHKYLHKPYFVRSEDRLCAQFYFSSPMGKIDRVRYKGLEVTYGSDHSHDPSPAVTSPKQIYLEPLVVG
ncbi:hypothetical protein D9758_009826 [Tetrapyrgos nigripes]|uniref:RRM domain-containing protein n=1 Tax=Tetrapyrgos nigripes TaxID=182062 RepID=A0A8H5GMI3_9AGAR|nr:hypothetical protein D9758_009826 [Tetrapyrgos nigripes]